MSDDAPSDATPVEGGGVGEGDSVADMDRRESQAASAAAGMVDDVEGEDMSGKTVGHEGYLQKKGDKGVIKRWLKRYFRYYPDDQRISYFKKEADTIENGHIDLNGVLMVEELPARKNGIKVTMKTTARVWLLSADTEENKARWIEVIDNALTQIQAQSENPEIKIGGEQEPSPPVQFFVDPEERITTRHDEESSFGVEQHEPADGDVSLFLYGNGVTYVKEIRQLELDGDGGAWVQNLPRKIAPDTVGFKALEPAGARVQEQRYYKDRKTAAEQLGKVVGREIAVSAEKDSHFEDSHTFEGTVCYDLKSDSYALVNEGSNHVHFLDVGDHVTYDVKAWDEGEMNGPVFRDSSLHWVVDAEGGAVLAELSYVMKNAIEWKAVYNGVLNARETEMEMTAWWRLENDSGKTFENAQIVLKTNPSEKPKPPKADPDATPEEAAAEAAASAAGGKKGKALGGGLSAMKALKAAASGGDEGGRSRTYWPTQRPTLQTVSDSARPTHLSIAAGTVPVRSIHLATFDTPKGRPKPYTGKKDGAKASGSVDSVVEFLNDDAHGLNIPLPAGAFNLFRQEKDGFGVRQIATDELEHHDPGDVMRVKIETLAGVGVTRTQTGFNHDEDLGLVIETVKIVIQNNSTIDAQVFVEENFFRYHVWQVTASTHEWVRTEHPRRVRWCVDLEALGGKETIEFTAFYVVGKDMSTDAEGEDGDDGGEGTSDAA